LSPREPYIGHDGDEGWAVEGHVAPSRSRIQKGRPLLCEPDRFGGRSDRRGECSTMHYDLFCVDWFVSMAKASSKQKRRFAPRRKSGMNRLKRWVDWPARIDTPIRVEAYVAFGRHCAFKAFARVFAFARHEPQEFSANTNAPPLVPTSIFSPIAMPTAFLRFDMAPPPSPIASIAPPRNVDGSRRNESSNLSERHE
jgi:hypothetical protein